MGALSGRGSLPALAMLAVIAVVAGSVLPGVSQTNWGDSRTVLADGGSTLPPPDLTPQPDSRAGLVQPPQLPDATTDFDASSVVLDGAMEARSVAGKHLLILPAPVQLRDAGGNRQVISLPVASAPGEPLGSLTDPRGRISVASDSGARTLTVHFGPGDRGVAIFRLGEFSSTSVSNEAEVLDVVVTVFSRPDGLIERGQPEVGLTARLPRLPLGLRMGVIAVPVGTGMTEAAAHALLGAGSVLHETFGAYDVESNLDPSLGDVDFRLRESSDPAAARGTGTLTLVSLTDRRPHRSELRPRQDGSQTYHEAPIQSGYTTYLLVRASATQTTPEDESSGGASNALVIAAVILVIVVTAGAVAAYVVTRRKAARTN